MKHSRLKIKSEPEVFIIESFKSAKEVEVGKNISEILNLSGKSSLYRYVKNKKEFIRAVEEFGKSKARYLHLSCPGTEKAISTASDSIKFNELAAILKPCLRDKRLSLSSSAASNQSLAESVMVDTMCASVVGPLADVDPDVASMLWATFYYCIFEKVSNFPSMKRQDIKNYVQRLADLYNVSFRYFSASRKYGVVAMTIRPKREKIRRRRLPGM